MKYCTHCGAEHCDDAVVCTKCGCPLDTTQVTVVGQSSSIKTKEEKYALAGMILGIVGLVFCTSVTIGLTCSILGVVFSSLARKNIKNGQTTAGLVTGIIGLSVSAIIFLICSLYFGTIFWFWIAVFA